jgi:hypothetical protein
MTTGPSFASGRQSRTAVAAPVTKVALGRQVKIGSGGQGIVYRLPDFHLPGVASELVYKEYFAGHAPTAALRSVVGLRDRLEPDQRLRLDSFSAWPCGLVTDGTRISGALMPIIPGDYFDVRQLVSSGERTPMLREVQYLFIDPRLAKRIGVPLVNLDARLTICRDLAAGLALLHRLNLVFGDINAKNAVFRVGGSPTVMLVDCDAVRRVGQGEVVKQLNAPDWDPPEGSILTQATDRYKYGLFVLRTLTPGKMMSTRRDPEAVSAALDEIGRAMLRAALSADRKGRPTLDKWESYFTQRLHGGRSVVAAAPEAITPVLPPKQLQRMRKDPVTKKWVVVE